MNKSILTGIIAIACITAYGEPEIKGTVSDLTHFINDMPKTVTVTGEAEVRVPAHRAVLSLRVITENKSLQEALRANLDLRTKLADFLKETGIPADRIAAAKFSSTPKFGIFSEKAKSYRVENEMRVSVQDEKEFQGAAGAVDKWSEVQFGGVEYEYADKEQQKQSVIAKACDNANERKKIYEEKLGLKLTPSQFHEGDVDQRNAVLANAAISKNDYLGSLAMNSATGEATVGETSFGEIVYRVRVSVEYAVQTK